MKPTQKIKPISRFIAALAAVFVMLVPSMGWGQTYSTPGAATYTVPAGVTCITVQIWGAGGAGGSNSTTDNGSGGGGGGGYTYVIVPVSPGQLIDLYVGQGGQPVVTGGTGGSGQASVFGSYSAGGGGGGAGNGTTTGGTAGAGSTYNGGAGGNGRPNSDGDAGGGGSSAGTALTGTTGNNYSGSNPGGTATAPAGGGNGGAGGAGGAGNDGVSGTSPGGGGGGGGDASGINVGVGGAGGNGQIIVTANALGICSNYCTNAFPSGVYAVTNVQFNTINNSNVGATATQDFTGTCTSVTEGTTYNLTVSANGAAGNPFYISAFFDWNLDGDFGDAEESVNLTSYTTATGSATVPITIPCTSIAGRSIQMRIINHFNSAPTSCETTTYGQAEYYCLTIVPATPFSAGSDQVLAACSNTFNLSATPSSGYWTLISGSATLNNWSSASATATISGTSALLQWNVPGTGVCLGTTYTDLVRLTTSGIPSVANAGANQSICGASATLTGNVPTVGTGAWSYYTVPAGGPAPAYAPTANTAGATASNLGQGYTYYFIWSITNAACPAYIYRDTMTVFNQATPTITSPVVNEIRCVGNPITNIVYTLGGGATGATVTGLPPGVSYSYSGNTLTISGTPTNNAASPYNFTVTTSPSGPCTPLTRTGTITVNGPTLSTPANINQSVCLGSVMPNIAFTIGGGATDATVTGLPAGLGGSLVGATYTIAGTPTVSGTFNYTVTTTGGCGPISRSGTITVNVNAVAGTISGVSPICRSTQFSLTGSVLGGGTGSWTSSNTAVATVSSTGYVTVVAAGTTTITYTITGGCGGVQSTNFALTVNTPYDACSCAGVLAINSVGITGSLGSASVGLEPGETECAPISGFTSDQQTHWYSFTATEACQGITVGPNGGAICGGMLRAAIYSGSCGSLSLIECKTAGSGGGSQLYFNRCDFVVGQTYYVQLSQYSGTGCSNDVSYLIAFQTIDNDMCTARQICDLNTSIVSYNNGTGNDIDLNSSNRGCLTYGERANNWFVFQATDNGVLTITVDVQGSGDYDYALWGPYTQTQANCATVNGPTSPPIRCSACGSASNWTLSGTGQGTSEPGNPCDHQLDEINVVKNAIYYLLINNKEYSPDAFTLTWGGVDANCGQLVSLPIELVSFTGHNQGRQNLLLWTTFSENNNDYFTLERSKEGENWEIVAEIDGAGNSQEKLDYNYIDQSPFDVLTYYRLKQTDYDGAYEYSHIVTVASEMEIHGLLSEVIPNPSDDHFFFFYGGRDTETPLSVELVDQIGNIVVQFETTEFGKNQGVRVDTFDLSKGVYYLRVSQGDKFDIRKVSKQ